MSHRKLRWIIFAFIIIALLGGVLHYYQQRFGASYRLSGTALEKKVPITKMHPLAASKSSVAKIASTTRSGFTKGHPAHGSGSISVQTQIIGQHDLGVVVDSVGTLRAVNDISIAPQVSGNVASIDYKQGALVKAGSLLFTLDSKVVQANLEKAQSQLALSKSDYLRYAPLAEKGLVSKQQLEQVHEQYKSDLANVKLNQAYLDQMSLRAPFSGFVGAQTVSVGDYVTAGQQLTKLVDRSKLFVNFLIPAEYLSQLEIGEQAQIIVPAQSMPVVNANVSYIAPEVDEKTHSVTVQAKIDNAGSLSPGLFVQVKLTINSGVQALLVPQAAVILQDNKHVVYVVSDGRAYSKAVITGKIIGDRVSIANGLSAGDKIVIVGQDQLRNGSKVNEVASK